MSSKDLVPSTSAIEKIGKYALSLSTVERASVDLPNFYALAPGDTPGRKHLSLLTKRIKHLVEMIEAHKLEMGYLIFVGNYQKRYLEAGAGIRDMEDYLINHEHIPASLITDVKRLYSLFVEVEPYGVEASRIQNASPTQITAVQEHVNEIKKQYNKNLDEAARGAGARDFRSLPPQKKEEISQSVQREYKRAIQEGANVILDSPPEEVHRIVAQSGKKYDRPIIIFRDIHVDTSPDDPPIVQITFGGGRCDLSEEQIAAMKRGNASFRFITTEGEIFESLEELARYADDAL